MVRYAREARVGDVPYHGNGFVRVVSQPAYPSGQRRLQEALDTLRRLKRAGRDSHEFWADEISLTDETVFGPSTS